jgi:hypothetical protein
LPKISCDQRNPPAADGAIGFVESELLARDRYLTLGWSSLVYRYVPVLRDHGVMDGSIRTIKNILAIICPSYNKSYMPDLAVPHATRQNDFVADNDPWVQGEPRYTRPVPKD